MSSAALGLALAAAVVHALWNLLLARERDTEATIAVSLAVFVAALAPLAAATWRVEGAAVPYILGSAALESEAVTVTVGSGGGGGGSLSAMVTVALPGEPTV